MQYTAYLLLGASHIKNDNVKNGHLFPATLNIEAGEGSVQVSTQSCCGHMQVKDDFNLQDNRLFIYVMLEGEERPKIRKWGKSDFRYFAKENDFRLSLAQFHDKNDPESRLCAKCIGIFYANDDVS